MSKLCEVCDTEIGDSEKICPQCGIDLEALEDNLATLEMVVKVAEKRKAKNAPPSIPEAQSKSKGLFRSLGKVIK